jgi:hypothetical protein
LLAQDPALEPRLPKNYKDVAHTDAESLKARYARLDTSLAQKELGMQFRGFKQTLDESVQSLLELEKGADW